MVACGDWLERHTAQSVEETLARAEDDWRHMQAELVDKPSGQALAQRLGAAGDADRAVAGCLAGPVEGLLDVPPLTKWNVVPPSIGMSSRS